MRVIFLDIDGVLNVYPQGRDEYGALFHNHFVDNLKSIIDATQAKIVISSTWRYSGLRVMQEMWEMRDLPGEVIDITEVLHINRGEEIAEWLRCNQVDSYVILDDDDDMNSEQMINFVKTSGNKDHGDHVDGGGYGLTKKCAEKAILILNKHVKST